MLHHMHQIYMLFHYNSLMDIQNNQLFSHLVYIGTESKDKY